MIKNKNIKVSLLISTYNWKEALKCSLNSAFEQTVLPMEVVIADDGSDVQTREVIDELKKFTSIPVKHVWHEDNGFRRCEIMNKGVAECQGDYIIQIDGDCVIEKHFIEDHIRIAEKNHFVCGSRVLLPPDVTGRILNGRIKSPSIFNLPMGFALNSLRIKFLQHFMAKRYARSIVHMRGCNMAYWKKDFISVNGYNEDLTQWGHEDSEFAYRLHFKGVEKKSLKMGGVLYHLYHKTADKSNEAVHWAAIDHVKENKLNWTKNGIDKYL